MIRLIRVLESKSVPNGNGYKGRYKSPQESGSGTKKKSFVITQPMTMKKIFWETI